MKKILLLLLLLPCTLLSQTRQFRPDKQTYVETNTGIGVVGEWDVSNRPFTSLFIGRTIDFGDYSLMDISVGLSYPFIASAKFGLGSYYGQKENTSIILGVRVRPAMIYTQLHTKIKDKGFFTFSIELGTGKDEVVGYTHLLNVGWKWPLKFKKKK
tara:strand:- start:2362 stop:2829 length:468 start_codon:yes stop_codon:yes gene_type:complete